MKGIVMRSLYEISEDLLKAMNEASAEAEENIGEISDFLNHKLDALEVEKELKTGNICRYYKSLLAEADMVKEESKKLSERARVTENKANSLKNYLAKFIPEGEKFADEHSKIGWRKSEQLIIRDDNILLVPEEYQKITISPDKTNLKKAIKSGDSFEGISILEKQNIQIK